MKQELLELTKSLVRIPSISSDIIQLEHIIEYIHSMFTGYDNVHIYERVYNGKPSLIIQNFSGQKADIVMSGHLDVVPAQSATLFDPIEKDGKLYGRGCGDMKDGCAIIITLMKEILDMQYTDKKISLWLTTDEETGGADGVGALVKEGRSGSAVLIPDAGDYTYVTYASKGIITVDVEVTGKAAHSSRPWKGDNALEKAYALYMKLKQLLEDPDLLYGQDDHRSTSVQLTKCHGGIAHNVIPEKTTASINIRYTEQYTEQKILDIIEETCKEFSASIVRKDTGPIMFTNTDHPLLQQFLHTVERVTGSMPSLDKEHGTTDGRYFSDETTVLLYQPTDDHIHTAGEYTTIDQLEDVYNIYKLFVLESTF